MTGTTTILTYTDDTLVISENAESILRNEMGNRVLKWWKAVAEWPRILCMPGGWDVCLMHAN
jgi:hypothetical protein